MAELSLRDRPAVVTGASRGVGRGIAARFAEAGGDVTIYSRSLDDTRPIIEKLTAVHDGRVVPVECDATDRDEIRSLVDTALDEFGEIRVLVNNVGGSDEPANVVHRYNKETFERMIDLNLKNQLLLSKEVLPTMVAIGEGPMIHVDSVDGLFGIGLSGRSEARDGLLAMSRNIVARYGQRGAHSDVIPAGTIETTSRHEEMENTEGRTGDSDAREGWLDQYPLGRFGTPREVAGTSLFLISELPSFITSENAILDGGLTTSLSAPSINKVYDADEVSS